MDKINLSIFRQYDIRGIYPAELNEQSAYLSGRAFARRAGAQAVVVGADMRLSSPALKKSLIEGILAEGVDVVDIGLVPVDAVYSAVGIFKYEAGIMITASHNPPEYNGFKMVLKDMKWIRGIDLRDEVLNLPAAAAPKKGRWIKKDIMPQYLDHIFTFVDTEKIKPLKIVVDAGNGLAGKVVPLLEKRLPIKIIPLNFKLDGAFPAHPSNPLLPESQAQLIETVKKTGADFGVIFDGDTDRLNFIDEKGNFIWADYMLLVLAKEFLRREPGAGIAYNVQCTKMIAEQVKAWGGHTTRTPVGYVNVSAGMKETGCVIGGEISSHFCFRDQAYADSGFIAFLLLLQIISEDGRPLSEIVSPYIKYAKVPPQEIVLADREQIEQIINEFKKRYQTGRQDELDGLTVVYPDWWFNIRASNTEPLLRIVAEADTKELLDEKINELMAQVKEIKG
jgi:phosphomannomutase